MDRLHRSRCSAGGSFPFISGNTDIHGSVGSTGPGGVGPGHIQLWLTRMPSGSEKEVQSNKYPGFPNCIQLSQNPIQQMNLNNK